MYDIKTVPAEVTDAMEKLQGALPESLAVVAAREHGEEPMAKNLSGNEVATEQWSAAASSSVN